MGQFVARASNSSLHTVFFVIRMKLTLCVIVLCSYLTLSAARTIPDRNDWENGADRTSHDSFSRYVSPYPSDTLHADQYIPPPPPYVPPEEPSDLIPPQGLPPPPPAEPLPPTYW